MMYVNRKPIKNPGKRERLEKKKKTELLKKVLVKEFLKEYEEEEVFNEEFEKEREAENKMLFWMEFKIYRFFKYTHLQI